jgi:hypothetical protein
VYFHKWEQRYLAQGYARWVPLFGDGTYVRTHLKASVDRSYRVTYKHDTQRVQEPNHYHEDHPGTKRAVEPDPPGSLLGGPSIYFAAFLVGDRRVPNPGDVFNIVWN